MAEEDWGAMATGQTFSLFHKRNPEEEAKKNTFVDIVVYNRWSRAERRLYQKLKTQNIIQAIEAEKCNSIDDITSCLEQLTMIRQDDSEQDPVLDDLISTLEGMKIKVGGAEPIEPEEKKKVYQIKN